jgi:hypothetical protein
MMEVSFHQGKIILVSKVVIDRSKFPNANNANDEYTPAQRKLIDARLAKAQEDIKHGRVRGPFSTVPRWRRRLKPASRRYGLQRQKLTERKSRVV